MLGWGGSPSHIPPLSPGSLPSVDGSPIPCPAPHPWIPNILGWDGPPVPHPTPVPDPALHMEPPKSQSRQPRERRAHPAGPAPRCCRWDAIPDRSGEPGRKSFSSQIRIVRTQRGDHSASHQAQGWVSSRKFPSEGTKSHIWPQKIKGGGERKNSSSSFPRVKALQMFMWIQRGPKGTKHGHGAAPPNNGAGYFLM